MKLSWRVLVLRHRIALWLAPWLHDPRDESPTYCEWLLALLTQDEKVCQGWLARQLGVSRTAVWRWVHGREPLPPARALQIEALLRPKEPVP